MKIKKTLLIFAGTALLPYATAFAQDAAAPEKAERGNAPTEQAAPAQDKSAGAEKAAETPKEKQGGAVRVTAARHEMALSDVPISVSVVSGEEVTKSSAATVADLLDDVPGVQISTNGPAGVKYVNIRGEGSSRTVVLVDGQRVTEQKSMEGIPILASVQDIERVEVIKGPASVLYGSDAIGGVVNIITKKSAKEDGVHGSAGLRGDSGTHGIDQYYSLSGRFGDFSARVSYSDEDHGNVESPKGTLPDTDYRLQNTSAYLAYDISENTTFGAKFEMFRGRVNSLGVQGFYPSLPSWDRDKVGLFLDVNDISDVFVKFHIDGYWQKTDKDFLQYTDETYDGSTLMRVNTRNKLYTYGLNAQADFNFADEHYLIVGAQLDYQDLDADQTTNITINMTPTMSMQVNSRRPDSAGVLTAALYAQDEWSFADDWKLVLGARGTYVKHERDSTTRVSSTTMMGNTTTTPTHYASRDDEDANATFSLSLVNTSVDKWTFRGTVSQGYRYATINELYIGSAMGGSDATFSPNPDLDPESSINYEIGARYNGDNLTLDATVFLADSDDYIAYVTDSSGTIQSPENIDSALTYGVELSASYLIPLGNDASILPYAVATFMRRKYDDGDHSTWDTNTPKVFGKLGVRGRLSEENRDWWIDLNMRGNSGANEWSSSGTTTTTTRTPGWVTYNVAVGVDITPEHVTPYFSKLTVAFGIDNISDHAYQVAGYSEGYWQTGRSYWLSLQYEF